MHNRQNVLDEWLTTRFPNKRTLTPLAGDASFRQYFRLQHDEQTYIVMDAPPDREPITSFLKVGKQLRQAAVHTPEIYAEDEQKGFIVLEDFGDRVFLNEITSHNADTLYKLALSDLRKIQQNSCAGLPAFDHLHMMSEMKLFQQWFLEAHLQLSLSTPEKAMLNHLFIFIADKLSKQRQVFIHRDYHSRNIMLLPKDTSFQLGIIDFQDAMQGPYAYDLVSILKDSYIQWPKEKITHWLTFFYNQFLLTDPNSSLETLIHDVDWCGLQRHLKVLGIFSRLHIRDQKSAYLRDLPRTMDYFLNTLSLYPETLPIYHWMMEKVYQPFTQMHLS